MEIDYRQLMVGGVLLLMLSVISAPITLALGIPSIIFGIIFVVGFFGGMALFIYSTIKYYKLKSKGLPLEDERTKKINYKAVYYSSFITLLFVIFLFGLAQQKIIPFSNSTIIWIIIFQFGLTSLFFRWYINKKSDV